MEPSNLLMKMLQSEEGCHKFIGPDQYQAYPDGDKFSIGYGCQQYFDEEGEPYVKDGDVITLEKAQKMLKKGVVKYQNAVEKKLNDNGVVLEQHQKDALTCFCYNIGIGGFNGCDLIKTIISKKNNIKGSLAEIKKVWTENWIYYQGSILPGLVNRRNREYKVFAEGGGAYNYNSGDFPIPKVNYEDTDESDALSKKTELQVKYFNTNYCNAVKCVDEIEDLGNTIDSMDSLVNAYVPVETMDLTGDKAMYVLKESKRMLGDKFITGGWEKCSFINFIILKTKIIYKHDGQNYELGMLYVNIIGDTYKVKISIKKYLNFDNFIKSFNSINNTNIVLKSKKDLDKFNELSMEINNFLNINKKDISKDIISESYLFYLLCLSNKTGTWEKKDFEDKIINCVSNNNSFYNVWNNIRCNKTPINASEFLTVCKIYTINDAIDVNGIEKNMRDALNNNNYHMFKIENNGFDVYDTDDKTYYYVEKQGKKILLIELTTVGGTGVAQSVNGEYYNTTDQSFRYIQKGTIIKIM